MKFCLHDIGQQIDLSLKNHMIRKIWNQMQSEYGKRGELEIIMAENFYFTRILKGVISKWSKGRLLDAGAGYLSRKKLLLPHCDEYKSCDRVKLNPELDAICDLTEPLPFSENYFDTVVNLSVVEHTRKPVEVLKNFQRVMKVGGCVILAAPFMFYEHGMPNDYYRFTENGIREIAVQAGFEVKEVIKFGGLLCSLAGLFSVGISIVLYALRLKLFIPFFVKSLSWLCLFEPKTSRDIFYSMTISVLQKNEA